MDTMTLKEWEQLRVDIARARVQTLRQMKSCDKAGIAELSSVYDFVFYGLDHARSSCDYMISLIRKSESVQDE